jgi:hypothetical protein
LKSSIPVTPADRDFIPGRRNESKSDWLTLACNFYELASDPYHGIRREELCGLRVKALQSRQGVTHFRIKGKRDKW